MSRSPCDRAGGHCGTFRPRSSEVKPTSGTSASCVTTRLGRLGCPAGTATRRQVRTGRGLRRRSLRAFGLDNRGEAPPLTRISCRCPARGARAQHEVRDRRDRGALRRGTRVRIAARSSAHHLAGLALDRQARRRVHPSIVLDAHELLAAELDMDGEPALRRRRSHFDQLLDRGRTLDDLAGGDLVRKIGRESVDFAHRARGGRYQRQFTQSAEFAEDWNLGSALSAISPVGIVA